MAAGDLRWGWWIAARRLATRLRRGGRWTHRGGLAVAGGLLLAVGVGVALLWIRAPDLYTSAATKDTATATTRAGVLALAAATLTETKRANRASDVREWETQVTDRYTKAIGQLGDPQLAIRLGGIYALERIAKTSEQDHPTVVEVLSAYVRQHTDPTQRRRRLPPAAVQGKTPPRPATDIQAAVTVPGRLPSCCGVSRGDLSGAHLSGAGLNEAKLSGAGLNEADLTGVELYKANLIGTGLNKANLTDAGLIWANLTGARLDRADLTTAKNLTQQQLDSARGNEDTKLSAGLRRPAHWSAGPATPPAAER